MAGSTAGKGTGTKHDWIAGKDEWDCGHIFGRLPTPTEAEAAIQKRARRSTWGLLHA
ncbi:hypothetical protein OH686_18450 [Pseudomonas sp. SO81]|nr:hypothetical protein OH686_18450 [Pseudomonas sp. SO81]